MDITTWAITLIAIAVNVVLGLATYYNNPKSATNRLFSIFAALLAFYLLINQLSVSSVSTDYVLLFMRLVMSIAAFLNLSFYLLAVAFPSNSLIISRNHKYAVITITLLVGFLALTPLLFTGIDQANFKPIPGPAMPLFLVQTLILLGGGLLTLIRKYKNSTGSAKYQIQFVLIGALTMFILIILTNIIFVFILNNSTFVGLLPIYTTIFAASIAIAIVKHHLLDINLLVARTITLTTLVVIITLLYAISLFTIAEIFPIEYHTQVSIILAVILAFTLNPLRQFIEKFTKNIFYKESYSSDKLLEDLAEQIRSTLSLKTLTTKVIKELHLTMHITKGVFVIKNIKLDKYTNYSFNYTTPPKFSPNEIHNLTKQSNNQITAFENIDENAYKQLLRQLKISIVIPLRVKGVNYGLLLLAGKSSGEMYSQKDLRIFEVLMPQLSVAVQNATSYSEIKSFAETLEEEVKKATHDLRSANRHLKHLDKLKNEFIFIATHELKNPVTAMRGYLSMLNEGIFGNIPSKMKEPVKQLNASNQQLVELVNDLLQIARTEAKTLTIKPENVDLCSTINLIAGNVKALADQKQLKIIHSCPTNKHFMVIADSQRLKEIANNLISNAIKYSNKGSIEITHELKDGLIITHVKDEGVGISPANQKKLFTRFFRVEEEAAKGTPGTGLGLYIIKQYIERMGGSIWLESQVDKGSIFSFSLPTSPAATST